jgi:hypothetical protein
VPNTNINHKFGRSAAIWCVLPDEVREGWDSNLVWDLEHGAEKILEGDAKLIADFGEAKKCIATAPSLIAARPTADLAFGDLTTNVVFRTVGVQRDLRSLENHQQFGFVGTRRLSRRSRLTKPVVRLKKRSKRSRNCALRLAPR